MKVPNSNEIVAKSAPQPKANRPEVEKAFVKVNQDQVYTASGNMKKKDVDTHSSRSKDPGQPNPKTKEALSQSMVERAPE
jgi:hypothetical protein